MTDIVERLRHRNTPYGWNELADKAADEIERLTKERDFARDAVVQKNHQYEADMQTMQSALNREIEAGHKAAAEVERLRTAAKLALHEMVNTKAPRNSFTDAVDALDAALNPRKP